MTLAKSPVIPKTTRTSAGRALVLVAALALVDVIPTSVSASGARMWAPAPTAAQPQPRPANNNCAPRRRARRPLRMTPTRAGRLLGGCRGDERAQVFAKDLAGGALGDRVHEPQTADLLVRRYPFGDISDDVIGAHLYAGRDRYERVRILLAVRIPCADHGCVGDRRVGEQHRLQLGWRHLVPLVLDQLLDPVDDVPVPFLVNPGQIAGVQPAVGIDG